MGPPACLMELTGLAPVPPSWPETWMMSALALATPLAMVPMPASAYAFIRQLIWVLAGDLVFAEGPVRHELHAGDCLHLGPPEDCVFRNEGNEPCTYAVAVLRDG